MPTVQTNGVELYYEIQGSGEPVLMIMGLSVDHSNWLFQVPALSPRYQLVLLDNRDVGQSSQAPAPYTIRDMADDTAGLLDALGIERAHVVGASMGGAISQELAINYPERVASLALLCTWPGGDASSRWLLGAWQKQRREWDLGDFLDAVAPWIYTYRMFNDNAPMLEMGKQIALNYPYPQTVEGFSRQADACLQHNTRDRLGQIQAPALVLTGDEDILTPPRNAQFLAERIPNARLVLMPAAAHGFTAENAEAVNAALLEHLAAHPLAAKTPA